MGCLEDARHFKVVSCKVAVTPKDLTWFGCSLDNLVDYQVPARAMGRKNLK